MNAYRNALDPRRTEQNAAANNLDVALIVAQRKKNSEDRGEVIKVLETLVELTVRPAEVQQRALSYRKPQLLLLGRVTLGLLSMEADHDNRVRVGWKGES